MTLMTLVMIVVGIGNQVCVQEMSGANGGVTIVLLKVVGKQQLTVMAVLQVSVQALVFGLIGTAILEVLLLSIKMCTKRVNNDIVLIERMNCIERVEGRRE